MKKASGTPNPINRTDHRHCRLGKTSVVVHGDKKEGTQHSKRKPRGPVSVLITNHGHFGHLS
jgi:hypothetical protein